MRLLFLSETRRRVDITSKAIIGIMARSLTKYRFGTATADFYVCAKCGVVPFVTCEIDEHLYGIVNTNTFEPNDEISFTHTTTDFDGEDVDSRLDRRQRNWIPAVRL